MKPEDAPPPLPPPLLVEGEAGENDSDAGLPSVLELLAAVVRGTDMEDDDVTPVLSGTVTTGVEVSRTVMVIVS